MSTENAAGGVQLRYQSFAKPSKSDSSEGSGVTYNPWLGSSDKPDLQQGDGEKSYDVPDLNKNDFASGSSSSGGGGGSFMGYVQAIQGIADRNQKQTSTGRAFDDSFSMASDPGGYLYHKLTYGDLENRAEAYKRELEQINMAMSKVALKNAQEQAPLQTASMRAGLTAQNQNNLQSGIAFQQGMNDRATSNRRTAAFLKGIAKGIASRNGTQLQGI
jgi:hypothetical protein